MVVAGLIRPLPHLMDSAELENTLRVHQGNQEEPHISLINKDHDFGKIPLYTKLFYSHFPP